MAISLSQQMMVPSLALVQSTSVPQTSHLNLLPNWFIYVSPSKYHAIYYRALLVASLNLHWLPAAFKGSFAGSGNDELGAAFFADIPLAYLVSHYSS